MIYLCCDKRRRVKLQEENARRKAAGGTPLNGIDYLEVLDHDAPGFIARQQTLLVRLFEPVPAFAATNVRLDGGERITPATVTWAFAAAAIPAAAAPAAERSFFAALPAADRVLVVRTETAGDFSTYRLTLVQGANDASPPADFDPLFCAADFSFKVECPADFDCAPRRVCPPEPETAPAIDYLAKDYASFRRLMLDRISLLAPQWRERNAADLGITLVELLAYVGDRLSYRQDATATEAYLETARQRISVRRHARLVDYFMHDGCNARAWVQVRCVEGTTGVVLPRGTVLLTKVPEAASRLAPASRALDEARAQKPLVFETMDDLTLFAAHDTMDFHTWADGRCCLPKGATRATLAGHFPGLKSGDVLIFEEVRNPETGDADDADRTRRHAVRLTAVNAFAGGGAPRTDPLNGEKVTEIVWDEGDALPFPFCVSAVTDANHGGAEVAQVSVARGNIVLADHGETFRDEPLGTVPEPLLMRPRADGDRCEAEPPDPVPVRFRPALPRAPVTQAPPPPDRTRPAIEALETDPADAVPVVILQSELDGELETWSPRRDLLESRADAPDFVAEVDDAGRALVRFGDDAQGRRPEAGTEFKVLVQRVGNSAAGNVGAEAIHHVVTGDGAVTGVRNPMPARGGRDPETMEEARQRAPNAFRTQERAVTEDDYAAAAQKDPRVQRAAATFRWTGSWHTVFVTADRRGGLAVDEAFKADGSRLLERYRMAGHDLEFDGPRFVPLEIEMHVCVDSGYFRSAVCAALLEVFGNRLRPDGRRGVFHPDNFTFGQTVFLSPIYAAAQAVEGVASVQVTTFQRQGRPETGAVATGRLLLDLLEIARCDNDPSFPERGVFRITLGGGK